MLNNFWKDTKPYWAWIWTVITILSTLIFPRITPSYSGRGSIIYLVPSISLVAMVVVWCVGILTNQNRNKDMSWITVFAMIFMISVSAIALVLYAFSAVGDPPLIPFVPTP